MADAAKNLGMNENLKFEKKIQTLANTSLQRVFQGDYAQLSFPVVHGSEYFFQAVFGKKINALSQIFNPGKKGKCSFRSKVNNSLFLLKAPG